MNRLLKKLTLLLFLIATDGRGNDFSGEQICAFLEAIEAIETGDHYTIHDQLTRQGINVEVSGDLKTYQEYLDVLPNGDHLLNQFAAYVHLAYGGLKLRLDPGWSAHGVYLLGGNVIYLGKRFMRDLLSGESLIDISSTLRHELVHARITALNKLGRPTFFDGMLRSNEGFNDEYKGYNSKFIFQEFATQGWQIFYHLRQARKFLRQNKPHRDQLQHALNKIAIYHKLLIRRNAHMPELAKIYEKGEFTVKEETLGDGLMEVSMVPRNGRSVGFSFLAPRGFAQFAAQEKTSIAMKVFRKSEASQAKLVEFDASFQTIRLQIMDGVSIDKIDFDQPRREFWSLVP